jgi:hypothetical protein
MRIVVLVVMAVAVTACCQCPQREVAEAVPLAAPAQAAAVAVVPVAVEQKVEVAAPVVPEVSVAEGDVVCRKGGEVRVIAIHLLNNGRCTLVYNNAVSGSGTENTLANRAACELQRSRMTKNFVRSGFVCE